MKEKTRTSHGIHVENTKSTKGGTVCAAPMDKSAQITQMLHAFQALTSDERNELLYALEQGSKQIVDT